MDTAAEQSVLHDRIICKYAAHLVAAMSDPTTAINRRNMSEVLADSLELLRAELTRAGYMAEYRDERGRLRL